MSSSTTNNTLSTCNYASLGNYDDLPNVPNTLGNIVNNFVSYPVVPNYQVVPLCEWRQGLYQRQDNARLTLYF